MSDPHEWKSDVAFFCFLAFALLCLAVVMVLTHEPQQVEPKQETQVEVQE